MGGISLGGIIVIIGVVTMIFWNFWIGLIVTLIGNRLRRFCARQVVLTVLEAPGLSE